MRTTAEEQTLKYLSCSFALIVLLVPPSAKYMKKLRLSWVTSSLKNFYQKPGIDFFFFFLLKNVVYCRLMGIAARDTFADRGRQIGFPGAQVGTPPLLGSKTAPWAPGRGGHRAPHACAARTHTCAACGAQGGKRKWQRKAMCVIQQRRARQSSGNSTSCVLPSLLSFLFLFLRPPQPCHLHRPLLIPALNQCTRHS